MRMNVEEILNDKEINGVDVEDDNNLDDKESNLEDDSDESYQISDVEDEPQSSTAQEAQNNSFNKKRPSSSVWESGNVGQKKKRKRSEDIPSKSLRTKNDRWNVILKKARQIGRDSNAITLVVSYHPNIKRGTCKRYAFGPNTKKMAKNGFAKRFLNEWKEFCVQQEATRIHLRLQKNAENKRKDSTQPSSPGNIDPVIVGSEGPINATAEIVSISNSLLSDEVQKERVHTTGSEAPNEDSSNENVRVNVRVLVENTTSVYNDVTVGDDGVDLAGGGKVGMGNNSSEKAKRPKKAKRFLPNAQLLVSPSNLSSASSTKGHHPPKRTANKCDPGKSCAKPLNSLTTTNENESLLAPVVGTRHSIDRSKVTKTYGRLSKIQTSIVNGGSNECNCTPNSTAIMTSAARTFPSSLAEDSNDSAIWNGLLSWNEKNGPARNFKIFTKRGEVINHGWPETIKIQFIPRSLVGVIDGQQSRSVLFHGNSQEDSEALKTALNTSNCYGWLLFGNEFATGKEDRYNAIKVMVLTNTALGENSGENSEIRGIIPNNQSEFLEGVRSRIAAQKQKNSNRQQEADNGHEPGSAGGN